MPRKYHRPPLYVAHLFSATSCDTGCLFRVNSIHARSLYLNEFVRHTVTWSEKILPTNGSIRIHGVGSRGLRVRLAAHLVTSNPLDFPRKQSHKSVKQFFLVVTGPWKRRKITQNRLYECYPDCRSIEYVTFRVRAPPIYPLYINIAKN